MLLTGPFGGLTDDLPDAAQLGFVFAAWWEGVDWGDWAPRPELGRLLRHERDILLQELAGLPPGQVDLAGFARRRELTSGRRPTAGPRPLPAGRSVAPRW